MPRLKRTPWLAVRKAAENPCLVASLPQEKGNRIAQKSFESGLYVLPVDLRAGSGALIQVYLLAAVAEERKESVSVVEVV